MPSMTGLIKYSLTLPAPSVNSPLIEKFEISPELRRLLETLGNNNLPPDGKLSLAAFNTEYRRICQLHQERFKTLAEESNLALEQYKLVLMRALYLHLKRKKYPQLQEKTEQEEHSIRHPRLRFLVFSGLLASGLLLNLIHAFNNQSSLVSLIPGLSTPVATVITLIICCLNATLFLLFEGYILKKNFGIGSAKSMSSNLDLKKEQLTLGIKISKLLKDADVLETMSAAEYKEHCQAANTINKLSIEADKNIYIKYQENKYVKWLRYGLTGFGAIMASGTAFFAANTLLKATAAALLGTPLGMVIVGTIVVCAVAFYFGLKPTKFFSMTNPNAQKFNEVCKLYKDGRFNQELNFKKRYWKKVQQHYFEALASPLKKLPGTSPPIKKKTFIPTIWKANRFHPTRLHTRTKKNEAAPKSHSPSFRPT